jgi:hypothetical protein
MSAEKEIPVFESNAPELEEWKKNAPPYATVQLRTFPDSKFFCVALPSKDDSREIIAYEICKRTRCGCKNKPCAWAIVKRE